MVDPAGPPGERKAEVLLQDSKQVLYRHVVSWESASPITASPKVIVIKPGGRHYRACQLAATLRFLGAGITDVTLEGRRLLDLVHNLRRHRIPWFRETPTERTIVDRNAVIITRINIGPAEGHW